MRASRRRRNKAARRRRQAEAKLDAKALRHDPRSIRVARAFLFFGLNGGTTWCAEYVQR